MKKLIIAAIMCWSSLVVCMESDELEIAINGTTINLIQANPYKPEQDKATITIAGALQQDALHEPCLCDLGACGDISKPFYGNYIYVQKEVKRNDDGPPSPNSGVDCIVWKKTLLHVFEPGIYKIGPNNEQRWYYHAKRRISENEIEDPTFRDEEALVESKTDLAYCYKNILEKSHTFFPKNITAQERNLILPSLSTPTLNKSTGMPHEDAVPMACLKVIAFVAQEKNKGLYNLIQFIIGPEDYPHYFKYLKRFCDAVLKQSNYVQYFSHYENILINSKIKMKSGVGIEKK